MNTTPPTSSGRLAFWIGLALGLLGPIRYIAEVQAGRLVTPWYLPLMGIAGAGLVALSWVRGRGVVRLLVALFLIVLAGGESMLVAISKLPDYDGPVAVGKPFPPFSTALADGSPFTQEDLKGKQSTAMVFFRGRW